jgi:hypothetical protein
MHLEEAFRLLKNPSLNFCESLGKDVMKQVRKLVIQLVLATDLAQHFDIIGTFKNVFSSCWEKVTRCYHTKGEAGESKRGVRVADACDYAIWPAKIAVSILPHFVFYYL